MTDRTLLVALVVAVALAATPLGVAGAFVDAAPAAQNGTATPTPTPTASANDSNASNASLGASVSAFMQASAAETEGQVDRGMFAARFNASDNDTRDELVRQRAASIEQRIERLRAERAALLDDDGNVTVAERAKAARLKARIESLQRDINQTNRVAVRANVSLNRTQLSELREAAGNLSGPEVAEIATGIVDRPGRGQGPPARGDRAEQEGVAVNGSVGSPPENAGNRTDGGDRDGSDAGNRSDGGNQSDTAAGSDAGNQSDTAGSDGGSGSDTADGSDTGDGTDGGDASGNSDQGGADGRESGSSNADERGR